MSSLFRNRVFLFVGVASMVLGIETKCRGAEDLFLPKPQQIAYGDKVNTLPAGRLIYLHMPIDDAALRIGQQVRDSLALLGAHWELTAAAGTNPQMIGLSLCLDPNAISHPQGYQLTVAPEIIRIVAHDPAGAFYAAQTLRQICRQQAATKELRCLSIEDWPDFPNRGIMLDISRDKVPTMETLYRLVDLFTAWKINQLQLYTEHTFAYRDHQKVWEKASPMTGEQILLLDAYCRQRFIELVPNQNSFGHMHRWLDHEPYQVLAEAPDGVQTALGFVKGFSLCPEDPGSIALLSGMYAELLPHFTSSQFNVGCDETFELGQGRSKQACQERGKGRVYLDFLLKIYEQVKKNGKTMQFWADIILHHPERLPDLPKDIIPLVWGYGPDEPNEDSCRKVSEAGYKFYVCPGTSSWVSVWGRYHNAFINLWNAAEFGSKYGAVGYLNTDWGDHGHWQPQVASYIPFAYGASVSWAGQANKNINVVPFLDRWVFQDEAGVAGSLMMDLGNLYMAPGNELGHESVLAWLLLNADSPKFAEYQYLTPERFEQTLKRLDEFDRRLKTMRLRCDDSELIRAEMKNAAALFRHACHLALARLAAEGWELAKVPAETRRQLADEIKPIIAEYQRLWLARSRPGGLPESVGRMQHLLDLYQR